MNTMDCSIRVNPCYPWSMQSLRHLSAFVGAGFALSVGAAEIHLAQGVLAGEVTAASVILQTRLTAVEKLTDGDVAGAAGVARFEIALADSFANTRQTAWTNATAQGDFIVKAHVD